MPRNPLCVPSVLNPNLRRRAVAYKPIDVRHQFGGEHLRARSQETASFFCFTYDQQKQKLPGLAIFGNPELSRITVNSVTQASRSRRFSELTIDSTLSVPQLADRRSAASRRPAYLIFPKIDWNINKNNVFTASYNRLRWKSPGLQTQATNTNARHSFGDDYVDVDTFNTATAGRRSSGNKLNESRFQYSKELGQAFSSPPLPGEPTTATTSQGIRSPQVSLVQRLDVRNHDELRKERLS